MDVYGMLLPLHLAGLLSQAVSAVPDSKAQEK